MTDETKQKVALIMLRSGVATVGELAPLRGVSRQALQKASKSINPRAKRKAYVNHVWKELLKTLTG
jgi:hypothetical protein